MSGCNEEKKGACCLYHTSDSSLTWWELGKFLGCASEFELACDQAIVDDPTRTTIFVPDKQCGPDNTGIYNDEIICPGLQKGTFLYKEKTSYESYVPLDGFSYDCQCEYSTYSEYMAKLTWSNNQADFNPLMNRNEVPDKIVIPDSWSTVPCSVRRSEGANCNDPQGSFCAIVDYFETSPGLATPSERYPEYGCIAASQADFNTALTRYDSFPVEYWNASTSILMYLPVPNSWENKNCKERVTRCGEVEGCTLITTEGTRTTSQEIRNCNCSTMPLGQVGDDQIKKVVTNKQAIPVKDQIGNQIDVFSAGDCAYKVLCDNTSFYSRQKKYKQYSNTRYEIRRDVLPTELQNLISFYVDSGCAEREESTVVCSPGVETESAYNSTIDACIHSSSVPLIAGNIPAERNWRVGACGGTTTATIPTMTYLPGDPCSELIVGPCHTYTDTYTNKVWTVFPNIYRFRLKTGFFSYYDRPLIIKYTDGKDTSVVKPCPNT